MKNKILIIIIAFNLLSFSASAITKPPFDNISISKNPVQYKEIVFEDFDGKLINLKNNNSKIYILNFWATWCQPCKEEMPSLDKLQTVEGIDVFAINIEAKNQIKTEKFFKDLNIKNLSIYFDPELNLVKLLTLRGVPTTVILNKDRDEIARIIGILDFNDEKFISWINDILSSKKINH